MSEISTRLLPSITLQIMTAKGPANVTTHEVFAGHKAILFGINGAFTPPCHYYHLPGFLDERDKFLACGIDLIACTAMNDIFVLDEWAKASSAEGKILFLADGNGDFAQAMGLVSDLRGRGLGLRSTRYAMYIEDLHIRELHVEPDSAKVDFSSAAAMLQVLQNPRFGLRKV